MTLATYTDFLRSKLIVAPPVGFAVAEDDLNPVLFPWQRHLVRWALGKGRAALFSTTGTGKTAMQVEWARHVAARTGRPVLILAPLAVTTQTRDEQLEKFGNEVTVCRSQDDVRPGVNITNYEMLHHFKASAFGGVVLDESSILKNFSGVVKKRLVEAFRETPFRLCCTATPAPNDVVELCNHADFLNVMNPADMLAIFFISKGDDQKDGRFRLKSHARQAFFRWFASWSMSLTRPSDLGYSDEGYALPPLELMPQIVPTDWAPAGQLLFTGLKGVQERTAVRRATLAARVTRTAEVLAAEPEEQWLVWCGLNDEGRELARLIPDAVVLEGADTPERKAEVLTAFSRGELRVLITKSSIAGMGLNFQSCARMAFLGLGDSFEQYFQAIRRCWRFGQTRAVHAHIVLSEQEQAVYENVRRKESEHESMMRDLIQSVRDFEREELASARYEDDYEPTAPQLLPAWLIASEEGLTRASA